VHKRREANNIVYRPIRSSHPRVRADAEPPQLPEIAEGCCHRVASFLLELCAAPPDPLDRVVDHVVLPEELVDARRELRVREDLTNELLFTRLGVWGVVLAVCVCRCGGCCSLSVCV